MTPQFRRGGRGEVTMRIVNILLAIVLVFFAALQYNDPDVLYWAVVYMLAAAWCLVAIARPRLLAENGALRTGALVSVGLFLVGFFWLAPTIGANWIHVEEARESFGYMICAVATAVALMSARSLARNGRAATDGAALT
jgi:hypothetical protein